MTPAVRKSVQRNLRNGRKRRIGFPKKEGSCREVHHESRGRSRRDKSHQNDPKSHNDEHKVNKPILRTQVKENEDMKKELDDILG